MTSDASTRLKTFRESMGKISSRDLAAIIGWPHSKYVHYEHKYKKEYLPLDLINAIRTSPLGETVTDEQLSMLAGAEVPKSSVLSKDYEAKFWQTDSTYKLPTEKVLESFEIAEKVLEDLGIKDKKDIKALALAMCKEAERLESDFLDENLARYILARAEEK